MRVVGAAARLQGMIYAGTKQEIGTKAQGVHPQVALKCEAVADNLDEAGDKLFTFPRFPESQWKLIRTSNGIERLHEEFKRRIKTQTVLASAETDDAVLRFGWLLVRSQCAKSTAGGALP
jgi:putative transposase